MDSNGLLFQDNFRRNRSNVVSSGEIDHTLSLAPELKGQGIPLPNLDTISKIEVNDKFFLPGYLSIWDESKCENKKTGENQRNRHIESPKLKVGCHIFEVYYKRISNIEEYRAVCLESIKLSEIFPLYKRTKNSLGSFSFTEDQRKSLGLGCSFISSLTQFSDLDSCKIKNCLIANGVKIGKNCKLENSIILEESDIGEGSVLKNCCIGAHSIIQQDCTLTDIVLGDSNLIKKGETHEHETLYKPQDNLDLTGGLEIVETRASRKFSQMG